MDELLYKEEMMWMQRSRIAWLLEGDKNTRFFHQKAAWRSKKNRIERLKCGEHWVDNPEEMGVVVQDFFGPLYTRDDDVDQAPLLPLFEQVVTEEMNEGLC